MISKSLIIVAILLLSACTKKNNAVDNPSCGKAVIIDQNSYTKTDTTNYIITNATINGNCLEISFGSSGCSGNTWITELVDADAVLESNPVQRKIKLKLTNNELCAAAFKKTVSFDISKLKVSGTKKIILGLAGHSDPLIYNF